VNTLHQSRAEEHIVALDTQMDELVHSGLDSALKLSLLSEAWVLSRHDDDGGTVADFASRLGYSDELVRQELDQLTLSGYFRRTRDRESRVLYRLTDEAPKLQTVRRLLASWRDLRFYLRATALLTFG
jgi:DNA-binding HxlR family transcriptional regulator